jgi:hypothetical protein
MPLILLPAVDVVEGRAVRLVQGKAGSETEYGSALDAALIWWTWTPRSAAVPTANCSPRWWASST